MKCINVAKPFLPPLDEFKSYLEGIWERQWITNDGPLQKQFSQELCNYLQVPNIQLTINGHMALELALREGIGATGEVITTPFTFASTVHAIHRVGAEPVFADITSADLTIDPESIKRCITERTSAIVPVHVYGHPCNTEAIQAIANEYHLKVVYDAAHAFAEGFSDRSILSEGDFSIVSFHATKLFHSCEGGAVICRDDDAARRIRQGRNFGILDEETIVSPGGNAKMNELQAAMGLAVLPYMESLIEKRKQTTLLYRSLLSKVPGLKLFYADKIPNFTYNYSYFPIIVEPAFPLTRDELYSELKKTGINTRRYFWPLLSECSVYANNKRDTLKNALELASNILCLPMYYDLETSEVEEVCRAIALLCERKSI